ncbi:MAG: GNAT family N-acetyltransferase [Rhodospirillaceae bacterium]|nr:MAG: GNAT family N-acetyltransferase [Rhodospirillaceae bacterium]
MSVRNLHHVLRPRSVAIIGASPRPGSVGQVVLSNVVASGFRGPIYPVNPRHDTLEGLPCYATIAALPDTPDLAVIVTPPDTVPGLIADLGVRGTRAAVIITAGFGEGGQLLGESRRQAVLEAAQPHLLRVIGPNCFGVIMPRVGLNASFARGAPSKGNLAFVTQSGAIMAAMMDWARPRDIGFSAVVSLGDMADADFGDLIDYLGNDRDTRAILLYVEAITNPRKFMSAARAAARIKPIIVIKGGRHAAGAKAARSHTGALAGTDAVYDAAFARAGLVRVRTMEQLFDTAALLSVAPEVRGDRLAIVTNGGGVGVLAVDDLLDCGGKMAELSEDTIARLDKVLPAAWSRGNPVDIIGDATGTRYVEAITAVSADSNADAILVMHCPTAVVDPLEAATAVVNVPCAKPLLTTWLGEASVVGARKLFAERKIPTFSTAGEAIDGFMNLVRYRRRQDTLMEVPRAASVISHQNIAQARDIISAAIADGTSWLAPLQVRQILSLYGIPANRCVMTSRPDEAATAAENLGRPVALKIRSRDIIHKSDLGGVILNLNGAAAVKTAAEAMLHHIAQKSPQARIDGFAVEEMILRPQAQELILGITVDRTFGPVIIFGHGGTAVEVIDDKVLGLAPLNLNLAKAMISETRIGRLLKGYRDCPPADMEAVAHALVALSQLAASHPEIADVDINPLLADADGIIAVDARIRLEKPLATAGDRLVICPYPHDLEQDLKLQSGDVVFMRPVRPEDEEAVRAMVTRLTPQDVRFRFFSPLKELGHPLAARLTQIDYDREMALIAFSKESADTVPWGIVRIHADPDNQRAEFAITVRSDRQDRGLGIAMLRCILDIAARRGIGEVWGDVMRHNQRMLDLCDRLGFTRSDPVGDPSIIQVQKRTAHKI